MKHILILCCLLFTANVNAQSYKENFDSNTLGWIEISSDRVEAIIKEGAMHLEGKVAPNSAMQREASFVETHCYSILDVSRNFNIKCSATAKSISDKGTFGIIMDYIDDGNFIAFVIDKTDAYLVRYKEGRVIGRIYNRLKITNRRGVEFDFEINGSSQKLEFYVNGMLAIDARYIPLTSNGFGFYVSGKQAVSFDYVEFIQN